MTDDLRTANVFEAPAATRASERAGSVARLDWVDEAKGFGIVLVVLGHIPPIEDGEFHRVIYWFHMPLFFFLGGVVLRRTLPVKAMLARRAKQLAIPYFVYLAILETPYYVEFLRSPPERSRIAASVALDFLLGGSRFHGPTGVLWFIPVLFFSTAIAYALLGDDGRRNLGRACLLSLGVALAAGYALPRLPFQLPYSIGAVPAALTFVLFGCIYRRLDRCVQSRLNLLGLVSFGLAIAVHSAYPFHANLDMKYGKFEPPALTLLLGAAGLLGSLALCAALGRVAGLRDGFAATGRATLTIMYLHGALIYFLYFKLHVPSHGSHGLTLLRDAVFLALVGLLVPLVADRVFKTQAITRRLFLGSQQ